VVDVVFSFFITKAHSTIKAPAFIKVISLLISCFTSYKTQNCLGLHRLLISMDGKKSLNKNANLFLHKKTSVETEVVTKTNCL
ncbi:MAG: hypothetical protein LH619_10785, partial [Chitinophagaceae bacterium]|nr:hypothetical protein [Chitinophagaceae bacterium]